MHRLPLSRPSNLSPCGMWERTLDMSKQRDIKEPKPGAQPSIIPIIETLKHETPASVHFFWTCGGTNLHVHPDVHVRTLHVLMRE